ncbi:MAG TPA: glutathione S-transferase family protein [Burkholderiales bacterium]|nr:glutathione S-transferase family protein [Burkholderiales bacterium]
MTPPLLVIGNKNYSSWSLRPWLFLKHHGIDFEERRIALYTPGAKDRILAYSPAGKVPILVDGKTKVWDSLAILEYLAERYAQTQGWPVASSTRAMARAVCAEMHSGFGAMREQMCMNVRKQFKAREWPAEVQTDINRIQEIWLQCRERHGRGGPFLFGRFGIVDAMFAPVVWRFANYSVSLDPKAEAYRDTMLALPAMRQWQTEAEAEPEVLPQFEMAY